MIRIFLLSLLLAAPAFADSTPAEGEVAPVPPGETAAAERVLSGNVTPYDLQCEYLTDPLGIDVQSPRLSWKLRDPDQCAAKNKRATTCSLPVGNPCWTKAGPISGIAAG